MKGIHGSGQQDSISIFIISSLFILLWQQWTLAFPDTQKDDLKLVDLVIITMVCSQGIFLGGDGFSVWLRLNCDDCGSWIGGSF